MAPIYPGTDDLWRAENLLFVFNSIITSFHSKIAEQGIKVAFVMTTTNSSVDILFLSNNDGELSSHYRSFLI